MRHGAGVPGHHLRGHHEAWDRALLGTTMTVVLLGLVMVGSASISLADRQTGEPF
jgi:hypothetical protein